nr:uncharacterized protein LOC108074461 [Drosophila kikkawai]
MCRAVSIILVILLSLVTYSLTVKYEFILEEENIFSKCHDEHPGYSDINKLLDLSNFSMKFVEGGTEVSGYLTTLWDNEPTDIIQASVGVTYLDRGFWQPTILNMKYNDFCSIWIDKNNFFYQVTSHILNYDEAKKNCLNVAGTKLTFEPFVMSITYGLDVPLRPGRYKMTYLLTAVDKHGNLRPTPICADINGSFEKLKTK